MRYHNITEHSHNSHEDWISLECSCGEYIGPVEKDEKYPELYPITIRLAKIEHVLQTSGAMD